MRKILILISILFFSCAGPKKTAEYYFNQGKIYAGQTESYKAIDYYTKAIKKNPNYIEAYKERAYVRMSIDSIVSAIKDYDSLLIKTNPNDYETVGKLYLSKGDAFYQLSEDTLACHCYFEAKKRNNKQSWNRVRDRCK